MRTKVVQVRWIGDVKTVRMSTGPEETNVISVGSRDLKMLSWSNPGLEVSKRMVIPDPQDLVGTTNNVIFLKYIITVIDDHGGRQYDNRSHGYQQH